MPRFLASELGAELEEARRFEWESEWRSDYIGWSVVVVCRSDRAV